MWWTNYWILVQWYPQIWVDIKLVWSDFAPRINRFDFHSRKSRSYSTRLLLFRSQSSDSSWSNCSPSWLSRLKKLLNCLWLSRLSWHSLFSSYFHQASQKVAFAQAEESSIDAAKTAVHLVNQTVSSGNCRKSQLEWNRSRTTVKEYALSLFVVWWRLMQDLDVALPILDSAVKALEVLKKDDITEVLPPYLCLRIIIGL